MPFGKLVSHRLPEQVLKDVGIWIAGRSYAGVSNSVSLETSADTPESTNFAGEFRTRQRAA